MDWYAFPHHCIGADLGMIADMDRSNDLRPRATIDMTANGGDTLRGRSDRGLLKDQAVAADLCIGVNHHAIRVRK